MVYVLLAIPWNWSAQWSCNACTAVHPTNQTTKVISCLMILIFFESWYATLAITLTLCYVKSLEFINSVMLVTIFNVTYFFWKGSNSFAASLAQFFEWKLGSEITTNDIFGDSFFFCTSNDPTLTWNIYMLSNLGCFA